MRALIHVSVHQNGIKRVGVNKDDDARTYTCCLIASLRSAEVAPPAPAAFFPVNELRSILTISICVCERLCL